MTRIPESGRAAAAARGERPAPAMPGACASGGCGCAPTAARPPGPSFARVVVNGTEIAPEEIAREMQNHPSPDAATAWRAAARALVVRAVLEQEAQRLGVDAAPEADDVSGRETEDDALVRALLDREVAPALADPDECRRVYDAQAARFRTPDLFEAGHILLEPDTGTPEAWASAEAEARRIAAAVGDDRQAFAEAAAAFSACPSARQQGSLGQIRRGDLVPAVQAALEALAPGTTGRQPVRSRFGWHVLRLERKIEGRQLPFEIVRDKIADMLEARAWATASARYVAGLLGRAEIEGVDIGLAAGTG